MINLFIANVFSNAVLALLKYISQLSKGSHILIEK